ncbi:hypothetical protein BX666DRAFT_1936936 [Dichotomocladium elegans]|nr:hypothetical protein BX666DRAFT_1936936 [Dichotomocladium elegans]
MKIEPESDPQTFLNGDGDATGVADAGPERPNAYIRYDSQNGNDLFQFLDAFGPGERSDEPSGGSNDNRSSAAAMSSVLQNMLTMLMSQVPESAANDQASDEEGDGDRQPRSQQSHSMVFYGGMVDGHLQFRPMNLSPQRQQQGENASGSGENSSNTAHPSTEEGAAAGDGGDNRVNNFASSLLRLLYGLSEGVVGNPNDYVFSQDGFDNIITQLMEQASGRNAPPPAPETVIDTLPKRPLNDKEIEDKTDCAVCKDEFGPTEIVNELPCQHVFHEDCIKPWLKVNGTCPVW